MKTNEKLGEILQLCLQLQASGWGDVNCDVSGHVGKVEVRGFKGGWKKDVNPEISIYTWYGEDEGVSGINKIINLLKSYINDQN